MTSATTIRIARSAVPMFLFIAILGRNGACASRLPEMGHEQCQARKKRETQQAGGGELEDQRRTPLHSHRALTVPSRIAQQSSTGTQISGGGHGIRGCDDLSAVLRHQTAGCRSTSRTAVVTRPTASV